MNDKIQELNKSEEALITGGCACYCSRGSYVGNAGSLQECASACESAKEYFDHCY